MKGSIFRKQNRGNREFRFTKFQYSTYAKIGNRVE